MSAASDFNDGELRMLSSIEVDGIQTANPTCAECSSQAPDWASICHGTVICLQCAGKHRGLGVGVSKVRSLTMDAWSEEQLQRMKVGGNTKCTAYFKSSFVKYTLEGGLADLTTVKQLRFEDWALECKYDSNTGEAYRARIDLLAQYVDVSSIPSPKYQPASNSNIIATDENEKTTDLETKKPKSDCFNYFLGALRCC